MKVVIQRVTKAKVDIPDENYQASISHGLLILLGIEHEDQAKDVEWLSKKVIGLRIFNDIEGVMNLSVKDIAGEVLIISQFTLHASTRKGNRPSYIKAAKPSQAIPLYESFIQHVKSNELTVQTGIFGADMKVSLLNDGPVTIIIDSKNKE